MSKTACECSVLKVDLLTQCISPGSQSLMVAYSIDLILVMMELFDITLQPKLSGTVSWDALFEAFEAYAYEGSLQVGHLHDDVHALIERHKGKWVAGTMRGEVKRVVDKYTKLKRAL